MRRIAVTGGIAEGKSTVLGYLRAMGHSVASSDEIAREVFNTADVQTQIASLLGVPAPVAPELLRSCLADHVLRRKVNAVTHPLILAALRNTDAEFVEVPLLIETCLQTEFDRIWVVTCGGAEQVRRLALRVGSEQDAVRLIRTQLATRGKIAFADVLIRTNQPESSVQRCVTVAAGRDFR